MTIYLAAAQALRRTVPRTAQIQVRPAMRERQDFGDSEIQQANFVIRADLNVGWLDVAMNHGSALAIDFGLEGVQTIELAQDLERELRRASQFDALLFFQDLRDGPALDVLHGDEETSIQFAGLVEFDHARIGSMQLLLD